MTLDLAVPKSEFAARMQAARATLAAMGADCAVLMAPEPQYWLCGYDTFLGAPLPQALILTPGGDEPSLVVWDADVAIAWDTSLMGGHLSLYVRRRRAGRGVRRRCRRESAE